MDEILSYFMRKQNNNIIKMKLCPEMVVEVFA